MNARNVYMTLLVATGLALAPGFARNAAADTGLQAALDTIQAEQIEDFHRRSLDSFPQRDIAVSPGGYLATGLADAFVREAEDHMRLRGRLARWSIQEEQLAGYRTGRLARTLIEQRPGTVAAVASTDDDPRFGQASKLLKSARFEWPEFMPPALLR